MKVRAAILREMGLPRPYATSRPLDICEIELADPGPGEVLVKVAGAGLCHSDLSTIDGSRPRAMPVALGHEGAGVVAALGAGVDDLAVGDHVVMVFVPSCGTCPPCMEGRPALCERAAVANVEGTLITGHRRISLDGAAINHHVGVSCFAEYAVTSRRSLVPIDPSIPLDKAALFGCAVLTGVGAVINTGALRAGQRVGVVGLGGVGLMALMGALAAGASQVIAVDLDPRKLDIARQLGATDTVVAGTAEAIAEACALSDGGVDLAVETAGRVAALETAYAITRRGGTTVTVGLDSPDRKIEIAQSAMVGEERILRGSYMGSCVPVRDIPQFIALNEAGRLPVERVLSEHVALDDINAAFDRLADGETVRQVLTFD